MSSSVNFRFSSNRSKNSLRLTAEVEASPDQEKGQSVGLSESPSEGNAASVDDFIAQMLDEGEIHESNRDETYEMGISENEALQRISKPPFEEVIAHMKRLKENKECRTPISKLRVMA